MSKSVTVNQAKTHLPRLLVEAEAGAALVITRGGKPVARLIGFEDQPRRPGRLKGKVRIASDFDAPLPEAVARAFRGESDRGFCSKPTSFPGVCETIGGSDPARARPYPHHAAKSS